MNHTGLIVEVPFRLQSSDVSQCQDGLDRRFHVLKFLHMCVAHNTLPGKRGDRRTQRCWMGDRCLIGI